FYLLAEAFDADPFQILHWRGRDRATLLANLRALRGAPAKTRRRRPGKAAKRAAEPAERPRPGIGAAAALTEVASPELAESLARFWVAPVPLPARPPTLPTDVDPVLRQLPPPAAWLAGRSLVAALRPLYPAFRP